MKHFAVVMVVLLFAQQCFAGPPKTKEEFVAAVRAAYEAKDKDQIHALSWEKGISADDRKMMDQMLPMLLKDTASIENITFEPVPVDFMEQKIAYGKRAEPTYPPEGMVRLAFKSSDPRSSRSMSMPYAVIDGAYYLVTAKTMDLGWKGPVDRAFTVSVSGTGQDKAKVRIKYNASGVDLEGTRSHGFPCQYISEVTVTSDDDDVDVTLSIADGMKTIYESKPLKGKGRLVYKKGDPSP